VRVYVPNNIELQAQVRLSHSLEEFGQELLEIEIGRGKNKCRNYDAPPIFDENLSGRPGPIRLQAPAEPVGGYGWRIKAIQHALIRKGYPLSSGPDGDYGPETARAVVAFFRDRHERPPAGIHQRPLPPEAVGFLLEALGAGGEGESEEIDTATTGSVGGGDECKRGVNLVPIYLEVDPDRKIMNENRSNNRVQFIVAIDCSNVAR
jgi:peptidoglycan hydrolase-like protein with peptidoglycan-binding domain